MEELKCDICGKTGFKSSSGLAGHKQIEHGVKTKTIVTDKDEIGKRLEKVERNLAGHMEITGNIVKILAGWKKHGTDWDKGIIKLLGTQQIHNTRAICRIAHVIWTKDSGVCVKLREQAECESPDDPDCLKKKNAE